MSRIGKKPIPVPAGVKVRSPRVELKSSEEPIPIDLDTSLPAHALAIVPRQPLRPGTPHEVAVSAVVDGREWSKTWRFRTR